MSYSCADLAYRRINAITDICVKETGSQNTFSYKQNKYMFETGREQEDGAIVGSITKIIENGIDTQGYTKYIGYKAGTFRIEANGTITRFLRFKKELVRL